MSRSHSASSRSSGDWSPEGVRRLRANWSELRRRVPLTARGPNCRATVRESDEVDAVTATLASFTAFVLLLTITAYSVPGGVDYGSGIWDLLAGRGAKADRARQLIDHAMAPVWEANNVWLVLAIVVCWTGFPLLFQSVFASLYPLFAVALVALILRGSFFAFRHVWTGPRGLRRTGLVFGISSILAPFFFAAALGAIASGRGT